MLKTLLKMLKTHASFKNYIQKKENIHFMLSNKDGICKPTHIVTFT